MVRVNPGVALPPGAEMVIEEIMRRAETPECTVTSTARTPHDQARVMYDNLKAHGAEAQKKLYKMPGQAVIDVYVDRSSKGFAKADVIKAMEVKIVELGPQTVSRHCAGPESTVWVVDIAPSSIRNLAQFITAAKGHPRVEKVLEPPTDPAVHLEILKVA